MGNYLRMFNESPGPVAPCQSWAVARSSARRLEPMCGQSVLGLRPAPCARDVCHPEAALCPCQGHPARVPGPGAVEEEPGQASGSLEPRGTFPGLPEALCPPAP